MKGQLYVIYHSQKKKPPLPLQQRLNTKSIALSNGKWRSTNMKDAIFFIKEWKVKTLWVDQSHSSILKDISQIQFSNLRNLSLFKNKIVSIEGLSRIYMATLQNINLSSNYICTSKEVRKVYWPKLQVLNIDKNRIRQLYPFHFLNDLKEIKIEEDYDSEEQGNDIYQIIKLKSNQISVLCNYAFMEGIKNSHRIFQTNCYEVLEKRNIFEFIIP